MGAAEQAALFFDWPDLGAESVRDFAKEQRPDLFVRVCSQVFPCWGSAVGQLRTRP